jgi:hypothetical protein
VRLTLNGTYQLLVYANEVNVLGDEIVNIKNNTGSLFDANKETGLYRGKLSTCRCLVTEMQDKIMI